MTYRVLPMVAVLLSLLPGLSSAAGGGGYPMENAKIDPSNTASLQRGAKLYVNYCLGCHALSYQRYNRMAADLGMTDELVRDNLMFTAEKVGETMDIAMPPRPAKAWFGQVPPDLTLIAREKGKDYLYTYLTTFYLDDSKPTGVNNAAFPDASMPWVMWELQGWQKAITEVHKVEGGDDKIEIVGFEQVEEGLMSPKEFDRAALDITNFLHYTGEPIKQYRIGLGINVIAYLLILFGFAYFLKREYWKEVH